MPDLPNSLALTTIADDADIVASDHRNNYSAISTGVNGLVTALSGGAAKQFLQATDTDTIAWAGDYATYTPTWTTTGTAPAIGNGSISGRYLQIGKLVHLELNFVAGSTTTFGTGTWQFSLPVNWAGSISCFGTVELSDTGNAGYIGICRTLSATKIDLYSLGVSAQEVAVTSTVPFTWGSADALSLSMTYEAA